MNGVIFILILVMSGPNQGGLAMQEFYSKASCERALESAVELSKWPMKISGECVPKQ
jgi:hypothetical protein